MPQFGQPVNVKPSGLQLATLIPALLAGIKDPIVMGAALAGFHKGQDAKRAKLETQQQASERRALAQAKFYGDVLTEAQSFDDPIAFAHWKEAMRPMAQLHGVDMESIPFSEEKKAAKDRKLVSDALDIAVKRHGPEILNREDVSIQLADGRTISIATAKRMVGGGLTDQGGKNVPITPLTKPDVPNTSEEQDIADAIAQATTQKGSPLTPAERSAARRDAHAAWTTAGRKPDDPATDVTALTTRGLDMAAVTYRKTGVMPALGMGDKTTRQRIINRAAELTPDDIAKIEAGGLDVATNKASFKALTDSLNKLTVQRAAIGAFEQTALKNMNLFLEQAGKVVDTGSPLANRIARTVSGEVLGSPNPPTYNAARQVVINEIAKITSNPNLSGSLSDSARHEVESFNPNSATLKQTVAVMRLLKQDMANRSAALDEAIADIKRQMSPGATSPNAGNDATASALAELERRRAARGAK